MKVPTFLLVILVGLTPLLLLAFFVIAPTLPIIAWQPPNTWSTQFGPEPNFLNSVISLKATTGGLYAGGYLGYPYPGSKNSSTSGLFVARFDPSGHQIWIRQFGDPTISVFGSVDVGKGGVIAAGHLNGRGFVKNYDPNGTEPWTRLFSSSQVGDNVYEASEGVSGVYSVGYYRLTNNMFIQALQAYDFTGNLLWNKTLAIDSGGTSRAFNVHASSEGVYVSSFDYRIGSSTLQRYDLNGTRVWTLQLDCTSCSTTSVSSDGMAVYVSGYVNPIGGNVFFLNKYDLSGNPIWSHKFTADYGSSSPIRMTVDSSGIYLAIPSVNGSAGYVMKYDIAGVEAWSLSLKANPRDVSEQGSIVYVGGSSGSAFLAAFWQSSSLVFLGLNPPFSFVLLAAIVAVIVLGILQMIRRYRIPDLSKKPVLKGVPIDASGPRLNRFEVRTGGGVEKPRQDNLRVLI